MGLTSVEVTVRNPAKPEKQITEKFLIDSGAAYSVMPSKILKRLGITPTSKRRFILANGELAEWPVGDASFRFGDQAAAAPVIFGEKEDIFLLGVTTLENLGLILDPIRRELKPLPMLLM